MVESAIGGENVSTVVAGRERYPINVRYMRDFRSDREALGRVLVSAGGQRQVPLAELADIRVSTGPSMIRNEDGLLTGYVYVDIAGRDVEQLFAEAGPLLRREVKLPPGYNIQWSGQYEAMQRVKHRLSYVVPVTLLLILLLLYINTRSITKTMIVMLAVPFSAIGAVWYLYLAGYNMSIAVWVGLIALLGVDAETAGLCHLEVELGGQASPEEKPSRLTTQSGNRGSACLSHCLPVRSLPLQLLAYRLPALKQNRQPRRPCKPQTNSVRSTTFWIARRTTFLLTRSSAWPPPLMTGREVFPPTHPNCWCVTSIRNI